jgi:DNA-binding NarL/FixJ family response regulator
VVVVGREDVGMIRVAVLDDHPAVLAGLQRLVESTDDLEAVAVAGDPRQLMRMLDGVRVDVVVLDYDLGRGDGLSVCQAIKARVRAPGVVVYSAYAGAGLAIAARVAGADALVDKRAAVGELLDVIRRVAVGESVVPAVSGEVREAALSRLAADDVPVASMLLAGTSHQGIAQTLGTDRRAVVGSVRRIVGQLRPSVGAPALGDAYCRRCRRRFERPLPRPYGAICPACVADGDIVSLTAAPEQRVARAGDRHAIGATRGRRRRRRRDQASGDA